MGNEIIYNTEVLISNLCDNNDAYILVKSNLTIAGNIAARVAFKNYTPFNMCIAKIYGTTIAVTSDLHSVMQMYSLIEHSSNYSATTSKL